MAELEDQLVSELWERFGEQIPLPDLFSSKLSVSPDASPDQALLQLAERHRILICDTSL